MSSFPNILNTIWQPSTKYGTIQRRNPNPSEMKHWSNLSKVVPMSEDKLVRKCSVCGKLWANNDDIELDLCAEEALHRGDA